MDQDALTDRQQEYLDALPADSLRQWGETVGVSRTGAESAKGRLNKHAGIDVQYVDDEWRNCGDGPELDTTDDGPSESDDPAWSDTPVADTDPSVQALTEREQYIATELQTGTSTTALAEDIGTRETIVAQHLRDLRSDGWQIYHDDTTEQVVLEGDHVVRSSEHKGTRTRKANRWWELRHNELVREFNALERPQTPHDAYDGHEDWVLHLTDLHAGDRVRRDDGHVLYSTEQLPDVIDYVTEQALSLAETHNAAYDCAHLLWGGDFITNEGIYEGQFEDLDAWLDEQHDILVAPLLRQLKAFAERFPSVQVVCQVGNHGQHRASGTSRQANADLILYKHLRNTVASIREYSDDDTLANVGFHIGQAKAYRNFKMRGGQVRGHLRHGQHRKPQAETSARSNEWRGTLMEHDFDVCYLGHHHISGRIPWAGPPIFQTSSPKPAGEFVERLGGRPTYRGYRDIATVHGMSEDGVTSAWAVEMRYFDQ